MQCILILMKIYTKTGDDGLTSLQNGKRVPKSDSRIVAYGTIDEINSVLGIILANQLDDDIRQLLTKIQNELFVAGSDLSNPNLDDITNRINSELTEYLEKKIDFFEKELTPLSNFIIPGGDLLAAYFHLVRTITRRAETQLVKLSQIEKISENLTPYLNRLSDLFFVLARTINKRNGTSDVIWKP